ncbi:TetR/AcrR family transcriptional regulator [Nonomuraea sp. NPDC049695]|uniref:TetR/AcrR family transcriptional regulator n=1 Tax=Nonomuraea sp. NPDC049695 TaxID=3154734 RepID=UPI0034360A58
MPPPNPRRREHIAGAAITVLAELGSRGLTHRAVDTAAGLPPGTTSRYFRTRDALMSGVIEEVTRRLDARVTGYTVRPLAPGDLGEALSTAMITTLAQNRHEPLAMFELHLESNRSPQLRGILAKALGARRDLIVRQCRAAGIGISGDDAMLLETHATGILFTALTTGVPDDPAAAIRSAVHAVLDRYRPVR